MSDWQAGDLALCVNDQDAPLLRKGRIYTVRIVGSIGDATGLALIETEKVKPTGGFYASRFVKITPGHKITGSEVDQKEPWSAHT